MPRKPRTAPVRRKEVGTARDEIVADLRAYLRTDKLFDVMESVDRYANLYARYVADLPPENSGYTVTRQPPQDLDDLSGGHA